jgi:ABC-2 type transport system permease protein
MPSSTEAAFNPWIGFHTLLSREVMRYLKLAVQTIGAPFLSNLLFLTIFGGLRAGRSAGSYGVPYLRFLVPGLVFAGAFMSAFQNPLFSLIAMKYQNTLQDLCQYPLSAATRYFAFVVAGALRGILVGAMTYAAAGFFAGFEIAHPVGFWLYVGLIALVAASGGVAAGLYLSSFEQSNLVVSLLLTPFLYLGGVFLDARTASPWLGLVARYDPLTFLVGQGRRLYLGLGVPEAPVTVALACLLCLAAVAAALRAVATGKGMKIE